MDNGDAGGYIYTSTDSGANWDNRTGAGRRRWSSIASSSDGIKLAAGAIINSYIYTSTDSGATWDNRTGAGRRRWFSITSSSDGAKLAAVVNSGYIYTSTNSGVSWTAQTSAGSKNWYSIASSSDGSKIAAVPFGGYIYTGVYSPDMSAVSYKIPYLSTNTAYPGYCVVSNRSSQELTVTFTVGAADNVTPSGAVNTFASNLASKKTKLITFLQNTISYNNENKTLTDTTNASIYGGTLKFTSTAAYTSGTEASCKSMLMECYQGTFNPKRLMTGHVCENGY
ncbi:MAG: hypothetical protein HQK92_00365 [Nitrospirae bacterium]|nr:hypothetical protein [Nitrospirota bacterium]